MVPTPSFSNPSAEASKTEVSTSEVKLDPSKTDVRKILSEAAATSAVEAGPRVISEIGTGTEADLKSGAASAASNEPIANVTQEHAEMLEKIADLLSVRMQSLKKREDAMADREAVILKRESILRQIEASLLRREKVIQRREKLPPPQAWRGRPKPNIEARYAAVLDGESMQFFYNKNATKKTPVASTQKLLTALIVCEAGDLDGELVVDRAATRVEPINVGIRTGEKYTRRQLLNSLLIKSGNDIATALAIDNAGSVEAFAAKMNVYGAMIGLVNSNFENPHGLPNDEQYSCARDIAIVAYEAYQNDTIRDIVKKKVYDFKFPGSRGSVTLYNTNKLLGTMEECNGMKTGYTNASGRCLVSSAVVDGQHRIAVVIKATTSGVWRDSEKLLDWALDLEMLGPVREDEFSMWMGGI